MSYNSLFLSGGTIYPSRTRKKCEKNGKIKFLAGNICALQIFVVPLQQK
jgi:hypothetical protein